MTHLKTGSSCKVNIEIPGSGPGQAAEVIESSAFFLCVEHGAAVCILPAEVAGLFEDQPVDVPVVSGAPVRAYISKVPTDSVVSVPKSWSASALQFKDEPVFDCKRALADLSVSSKVFVAATADQAGRVFTMNTTDDEEVQKKDAQRQQFKKAVRGLEAGGLQGLAKLMAKGGWDGTLSDEDDESSDEGLDAADVPLGSAPFDDPLPLGAARRAEATPGRRERGADKEAGQDGRGKHNDKDMLSKALRNMGTPKDPQALLTFILAKKLLSGGGGDSDDSSSNASSRGSDDRRRKPGHGFRNLHRRRAAFKRRPLRPYNQYRTRVREDLGVTWRRQHWRFREHHLRLRPKFGKMSGLFRVFVFLGDLLDLIEDREWQALPEAIALLSQALLQVALDSGSWEIGALMLPFKDPLERQFFGGEPALLEDIARYRKAVHDLRAKMQQLAEEEAAQRDAAGVVA